LNKTLVNCGEHPRNLLHWQTSLGAMPHCGWRIREKFFSSPFIMAAHTISGYIQGLLDGIECKQTAYALDRDSRKAALARFLKRAASGEPEEKHRLAA